LLGFESREPLPEIRIEPVIPKKNIEGAKREIYNQIGEILEENRINTKYSEDQVYPRLKKSLMMIGEIIDANKEMVTLGKREQEILERRISECKEERNLSADAYDILKFIYENRHEHPSILSRRIASRILWLYDMEIR
jgi:hypothetical protein